MLKVPQTNKSNTVSNIFFTGRTKKTLLDPKTTKTGLTIGV